MRNTIAALKAYDEGQAARDASWEAADTNKAVSACQTADKEALDLVRRAFLEDTKTINRWSGVKVADLNFMRRCAAKAEKA